MRAASLLRVAALVAAVLSLGALPATATASSSQAEIDAAVAKGAEFLIPHQDPTSGGFETFGGEMATTAVVAAGVDAGQLRVAPGDPSLQDFWLGEYSSPEMTEDPPTKAPAVYEQAILTAHAAGLDPARLTVDANLPAQLAALWNPATGSFGDPDTNGTAFGILALATTPLPRWALAPAVSFLRRNQHSDGGWTYPAALTESARETPSEEDITGAAIAALCEAGVPAYDPAVATGLEFLRGRMEAASGGIRWFWGPANADTNGWVLSGLNACGIDPQSTVWTSGQEKNPVDFLLSLQVQSGPEAGGFGYEDNSGANFYATQDAVRSLAGDVFTATPPSVRTPAAVAAGTSVPHLLAVELAPGNVRFCKVVAPAGATLTEVLTAARSGGEPRGCVTSFAVNAGKVVAIDGVAPESSDDAWLLRIDRGAAAVAGEQPVGFGDVVSLRVGAVPAGTTAGPTGPAGPSGAAGASGPAGTSGAKGASGKRGRQGARGKRGPRGRPGRNATIGCKAQKRRGGKQRLRCAVKNRRHQRAGH